MRYVQEHPGLEPGFAISEADLRSFHAGLAERGADVDISDLMRARRYVEFHLGGEVALQLWDDQGLFRRVAATDAQVQKALELLVGARDSRELFEGL